MKTKAMKNKKIFYTGQPGQNWNPTLYHPVIYIYKKEINYLFLDGASMPTLVIVPPVSVN